MVVEAEIFPSVLTCLKDSDELVVKNTATLIREIAKHTPELCQLIMNAGGIGAIIDYIGTVLPLLDYTRLIWIFYRRDTR